MLEKIDLDRLAIATSVQDRSIEMERKGRTDNEKTDRIDLSAQNEKDGLRTLEIDRRIAVNRRLQDRTAEEETVEGTEEGGALSVRQEDSVTEIRARRGVGEVVNEVDDRIRIQ